MSGDDEQEVGQQVDGQVDHDSPFRHHVEVNDQSPITGGSPIGFLSPVHRNIFRYHQQLSPDHHELYSPPNIQDRYYDRQNSAFQQQGDSLSQQQQAFVPPHQMPTSHYASHYHVIQNAQPQFVNTNHSEGTVPFSKDCHPFPGGYDVPTHQPSTSFESNCSGSYPLQSYPMHSLQQPTYHYGPPQGYYHWPPAPPQNPIEYIRDIKPSDVLCGRGGATNSHSGNRTFRTLVKRHQGQYLKAKKRDKPSVADILINLIRERGGRFLKRAESQHYGETLWIDIGDERAREKTCQALREGAPELRRRKGKSPDEDDITRDGSRDEDTLSTEPIVSRIGVEIEQSGLVIGSTQLVDNVPSNESRKSDNYHTSDARDDEGSQIKSQDQGPIIIQPSLRLMRRKFDEISVETLTPQDRELYLNAFLPPHTPMASAIGRERTIILVRSPSAYSEAGRGVAYDDDDINEDRDFAEV